MRPPLFFLQMEHRNAIEDRYGGPVPILDGATSTAETMRERSQ